jgi:hypothetical protein
MSFIKWAIVLAIGIFIGMSFASAALADDIVSYYKLDEASGNAIDADGGTHNLTETGTIDTQTGIISGARGVFGNSDYFSKTGVLSVDENTDFTINLWVKRIGSAVSHNTLVELGDSGTANDFGAGIQIRTNQKARIYIDKYSVGGDLAVESTSVIPLNVWTMVTFTYNGSTELGKLYIDGSFDVSDTNTYTGFNGADGFAIGNRFVANVGADVSYIDETGLWNSTLGDTEVADLYNSGIGRSYPFVGTASLNSPANEYVSPTTSVEFNATSYANNGETLVNMTLYHNASGTWTAIETQSITGTENTTNWTDTFSDGDDFIWGVQGCDTLECFFSGNRSLSIDTTNPIIDIITPANGTLFGLLREIGDTQDINYTITDTNLDTCWYEYNGVNTTFGTDGNCEYKIYSSDIGVEDLIAYYELDETTGVVVDELGTNDGTNYGSTRGETGIINYSFYFDGSNDYVGVPHDASLQITGNLSVSLWFYIDAFTTGNHIIEYRASGESEATNYLYSWLINSDGSASYGHEYGAGQDEWRNYNPGLNTGEWYHLAMVRDVNLNEYNIYLNGEESDTWSFVNDPSGGSSGSLRIGADILTGKYHDGRIDEVGIWDRVLTFDEVSDLYNSGVGQPYPFNDTFTLENVGTLPWHELTIYANDTAGNVGSNSTSWEYDVFVTNQTWNNETTEGAVEPFTLNATLGTGLTFNSATLTYNGTDYAGTITNTGGTDYYIDTEIDISNVDAEEKREFYWNLALSNGESYNTSTQTQNVTALFIDDCTSFGTLILNYTLYDEDTQDLISPDPAVDNATIEINIDVSPLGSTTPIIEYSNTFETNNATICMDNLETNYRLDVTTKYSAFDHVVEYHHIQNYQLNSSSEQHISLYDLATTESQEFLVVFKDENFVLVQDALIDISREYVGEGLFKSVEVAKTDSQGQTIVHLVLGDVRYDIVVKKEGEILATFDNVVAVCQDAGSGECTLNLNQLATQVQPLDYENLGNIAYYWTLDRADRTIQVDFTSTDSLVVKVDLNVTKFDNYFNESVCDETLTSTTGTITCNIPANFGNVSFLAELYSDGEFVGQTLFSLSPQALESFGYTGVIMVIIMFMVLPLMFVSSPVGMVFGGIIAIVMMGLLSMFDYGGTLLGSGSMIMWFIVAGLILVWRMSKGGKSQ